MTQTTFLIPDPGERQSFTGERYTTGVVGDIQSEHYHRYLFALRLCKQRDVLDVASGEGYGAALLADVARSVVGVDVDEPTVAFAARAYTRDNLFFRQGNATALPLADASVDVVVSFETIEHLTDHSTFLREIKRVLRPNGIFVVSTPDRRVYSEESSYRNPFHLHELNREEFSALLGAEFPHVRVYEQQVLAGSVIAAVAHAEPGTESFAAKDGRTFLHKPQLPNAPYLVAVAAAEDPSLPAVSVLHGLWTDAAGAPQVLEELRAECAEFRQKTQDANTENAELRGQLLEANAEITALRNELLEANAEITALRNELLEANAEITALRNELLEANAEITALRDQLLEANFEAEKMTRKLLEMDHERGFLRAMFIDARRHADQARANLVQASDEIDALRRSASGEIDAFRRSTSWRVTRPLRGARIFARRILG